MTSSFNIVCTVPEDSLVVNGERIATFAEVESKMKDGELRYRNSINILLAEGQKMFLYIIGTGPMFLANLHMVSRKFFLHVVDSKFEVALSRNG